MYWLRGRYIWTREMTEADAPFIVQVRNLPEVSRFLQSDFPLTVEQHLDWFAHARNRDVLLIHEYPDGVPIASAAHHNFDKARKVAEYGRGCRKREVRGELDIKECIYTAMRVAFELFGVEKSYIKTSAENLAVRRIGELFGYKLEGIRRRHLLTANGYTDIYDFGMLPDEHMANRSLWEQKLYGDAPPPQFEPPAYEAAERLRKLAGLC